MIDLRAKTCIVGVGESVPREACPDYWKLAAETSLEALNDAGLTTKDIDGVVFTKPGTESKFQGTPANFCDYMGIKPAWMEYTMHLGAPILSMLWRATFGIVSGFARTVLIVSTDTRGTQMRAGKAYKKWHYRNYSHYDEPVFGSFRAPGMYAQIAQRHMYQYGTTSRQMAAVAVALRKWAALHPLSLRKDPITIDDVLKSPMITTPFHLLDIALTSDGGGAAVVVGAERARDFPKPPVHILGLGECAHGQNMLDLEDFADEPFTRIAANEAFGMAGVTPKDINIVYPLDMMSFMPILTLEELGFCKKGEGGAFVEGGRIEPGGDFPICTHGGQLSHAHPGSPGPFHAVVEAVRQLRGECGPRQVPKARLALCAGAGAITRSVSILGRL